MNLIYKTVDVVYKNCLINGYEYIGILNKMLELIV